MTTATAAVSVAPEKWAGWADELLRAGRWLGSLIDEREDGLASTSDENLGEVLGLANGMIAKLTALKATTLRAKERNGAYRRDGHRTVADWNASVSGNGLAIAAREAKLAEDLGRMPEVEQSLNDGEIAPEHALVFSRMVRSGDAETRRTAMENGTARELLEVAKRQDPGRFGKAANRKGHELDRNALQRSFNQVRAKRYLRTRPQAGGLYGEFFVDNVAGEQLLVALEAQQGRPTDDDERTYEQRRADGLVDLAKVALDSGVSKKGALVRPHVIVTMSAETFAAARAQEAERESRKRPRIADDSDSSDVVNATDVSSVIATAPAAEFPDGTLIPPKQLGLLLCDSQIGRVVISAKGVPLNVGRSERTASDELRRAVITRDRSCRFPGCDKPARWSHFHHIRWWSKRGDTSAENGILLCDDHHENWVHARGVVITSIEGGFEFHHADGRLIGRTFHDGVDPNQLRLDLEGREGPSPQPREAKNR